MSTRLLYVATLIWTSCTMFFHLSEYRCQPNIRLNAGNTISASHLYGSPAIDFTTAKVANSNSVYRNGAPTLFLLMKHGTRRVRCHATQTGLGNVRVAKLADYSQYRVHDEARQVLLDQVVVWLIAFLCDHWTMPRSTDPYFLQSGCVLVIKNAIPDAKMPRA